MDLNVLKTFVAVCEYSGFSAAAEKLGYSQSTVSSQIKQLESELNVVLFDRIRHGIKTTRQGNIVLEYAKEILSSQQQMISSLHKSETVSGEIRLAMSDSVCARYINDRYITFHEYYPDIQLKITSSGTEQMFDMLRKNEVDIVFTLESHIFDSEFTICGEAIERTHFVCSKNHPLVGKKMNLQDIVDEKFFLTERNMSYRSLLDTRLAYESLEIHPILELGDPDIICSLLQSSNAISFLPDFITEEYVREGSLVYLDVPDCSISVWTQILMHKDKWISPAMEAFVEYYKDIIEKKDN